MENYGARILRALLYDTALNRQSLQVNPEPRPSPDEVEFETLERAVRSVQRFLGEAIRTIAAEGRSRRSSPSNLPVELFSWIIKNVLVDSERHRNAEYYGQLTKLCLVCKEWADTIHGLPELWTQVNLSGSRELLAVVISRSRDFPLDVTCYMEDWSLAVSEIVSVAHRWRSLDIRWDDDFIRYLLPKPAPRLKELTIIGPKSWVAPTNIFEGTAPQLEVVVVQGCGLPWKSPILSDLRNLTLWEIKEHPPQLDILLDILAASPRLSELVIGFTPILLDIYTSSRRVQLPNLRSLRVDYLYPEAMTAVLNSIDAPLSAACVFGTQLEGDEEMAVKLADVSKRLVALAQSVRSGSGTLTLKMGHDGQGGWIDGEDWNAKLKYETEEGHLGPLSITVNSSPEQHSDILNHLAGKIQLYTKASPPKLRLVGPDDDDARLLLALHHTFPNIREIALDGREPSATVEALRHLFPQPSSETSPLFPHLTTLTVKQDFHDYWAEPVHRYRRHAGKEGGVNPLPTNLILRLEDGLISAEYLQALQQLAPGRLSFDNVRVREKVEGSAHDEVEYEDLERAVRPVQRFLGEAIRTIAAEGRSRRSSPPNLPVELFSWIIKNVLVDSKRHRNAKYYGQLTKLCLVCKEWADTIHGLPELWTQVNLSGSRELLAVILSRSRDFPLDVTCYMEDWSLAVSEIVSVAHRWRSLDIRSGDDFIDYLLPKPAPLLQELTIIEPKSWVALTDIFEGTAPQLEVVVVQGCGLPWKSPILSDLRNLTLWKIKEHPPQLDILLNILAASPRLSELVIGFTPILLDIDIYTSSRRVKLPNLRSLRVESLHPEAMTAVLNSIDVPLSAACVFGTRLEDDEEMAVELADVSKRLVALAQSVRNGSSTLTLKMGHDGRSGRFDGEDYNARLKYETEEGHPGPLSITVNAPLEQHSDILNHLAGKIQPYTKASPPQLQLIDIHQTVPKDDDGNLLYALHRTFPNVQEIALGDLRYYAMGDALRRLFPQPSSETSPLFPHLTTLTVKQDSHNDLPGQLHSYRRNAGEESGVNPLPTNLILRLEDGSISAGHLQALQQLAPGRLSFDNVWVNEMVEGRWTGRVLIG